MGILGGGGEAATPFHERRTEIVQLIACNALMKKDQLSYSGSGMEFSKLAPSRGSAETGIRPLVD